METVLDVLEHIVRHSNLFSEEDRIKALEIIAEEQGENEDDVEDESAGKEETDGA
jgi:hypothetical protein